MKPMDAGTRGIYAEYEVEDEPFCGSGEGMAYLEFVVHEPV